MSRRTPGTVFNYRLQVTKPMDHSTCNQFLSGIDPADVDEVKTIQGGISYTVQGETIYEIAYVVVHYERKPVDGLPVEDPSDSPPKPATSAPHFIDKHVRSDRG